MDVILYSGNIDRGADLRFIEFLANEQKHEELLLIVSTPGGSPDAAYKVGKYIQNRYQSVRVFVPGFCKSAGTLLAISASELVFSPYGELGPLDIQMMKTDNISGLDSGLNIGEAFSALEQRAKGTFHDLIEEIVNSSAGAISFQTASHSAAEILASLYGPVFGRIDPEEVGSRARAMRIGEDYGRRLNMKFGNLKNNALHALSRTYSSHGFVIDMDEAKVLFSNVREASEAEKLLVEKRGNVCRLPGPKLCMENLTESYIEIIKRAKQDETGSKREKSKGTGSKRVRSNGRDPERAAEA